MLEPRRVRPGPSRERDPSSAFLWAISAHNEEHRFEMVHEVMEHWKHIDLTAATAALSEAPVTAEQRADLAEVLAE